MMRGHCRRHAAALLAQWRSGVAAAAFAGWQDYRELRQEKQAQVRAAIGRWQCAQLASLFGLWQTRATTAAGKRQDLAQVLPFHPVIKH